MVLTCLDSGRRKAAKIYYDMIFYMKEEEKTKTKTTWKDGIHGIMGIFDLQKRIGEVAKTSDRK